MKNRCRKKLTVCAVFFLVMVLGMSIQASAAWKKNTDGTYSYYSNGKLVTNKWIDKDYYVNKNGIRQTGWFTVDGKKYFATNAGRVLKKIWIRSSGKMYYAGADGAVYVNGRHKVGSYYYAFSKNGERLTGMRTYKSKTYYFHPDNGRMQKKLWVLSKKKYYYFGKNGSMAKSTWIGRYYVDSDGVRVMNAWQDNKYLGSNGKAVKGLQQIGGEYYYFNTKTYEKVTSTYITVNHVTYAFDGSGKGVPVSSENVPPTKESVELTYYTDEYVNDEELFAAILYCEAGNQAYAGQVAVGLVIMNRVADNRFPNTLREVVYQKQQFTPARDGSLTRVLKNPSLISEQCRKAAKEVRIRYDACRAAGTPLYLVVKGEKVEFKHIFFMTESAYKRLGLTAAYEKIGDHLFFSQWK